MAYDRKHPYNELPKLPPAEDKIQTVEILKKLISANKALAKLDGISSKLPNPEMLVNTITLQEARTSTEIENIFTTDDELYKAASSDTEHANPATKEVLKYRESLWEGVRAVKTDKFIDEQHVITVYRKVKDTNLSYRPSHLTTVIKKAGNSLTSGEVVYTPPRGEGILQGFMKNWVEFLNNDDDYNYDPLLKLAITHYQFEAIHPFNDGNGRTGRILNLLVLIKNGLLTTPILYLSKYIIQNKDEYYECLGGVTERKDWKSWILFILDAVEQTSNYTISKINEITEQLNTTAAFVAKKHPHIDKEIIEMIFTQPYVRGINLLGDKIKSRNTAAKYLKQLAEIEVLESKKIGRESIYINNALLDILSH